MPEVKRSYWVTMVQVEVLTAGSEAPKFVEPIDVAHEIQYGRSSGLMVSSSRQVSEEEMRRMLLAHDADPGCVIPDDSDDQLDDDDDLDGSDEDPDDDVD